MPGLLLSSTLVNQNWGNAVQSLAEALAQCKGINDLLNDADRMPGGPSTALQNLGLSAADAGLLIASFGDLAALYRVAHAQQQQVGNNDFFFNAKKLLGTVPMPL
jgi:hypothetical protein